ncbi:MAG TPA: hypothetical protein VH637_24835 [Streptosporangiaceae bacterium]|jgi:molecular chaperone DnaK (HSP70)
MASKPRVVAAIDFGTHASGYAWVVVDPRVSEPAALQIVHNKNWPGNEDVTAAKTRTALLVDDSGAIAAYGSQVAHEYRARKASQLPLGTPVEDFKVALKAGPSGYRVDRDDRAVLGLKRAGISLDQAVTAYLRWIYERALADMASSGIQTEDIDWCLTVPAIWEPAEKDRMRAAAHAAGLPEDRLLLALEPEAAAIQIYYTQGQLPGGEGAGGLDLYQPGSRFMIVDGGGGTVDITAYQVAEGGGLAEIGRAKGERLGSQYLNQGFVDLVSQHLGTSTELWELDQKDPVGFGDLIRNWEAAKRHVLYEPKVPVEVPLGARMDRVLSPAMRASLARTQDGVDDAIVVQPEEVDAIFAAVVAPTLDYIDQQLGEMARFTGTQAAEETIALAGGFAASPYLQEAIRRRFAGRARVIQALNPEIAVLHGAVHFARDPSITRVRRVQYTWGVDTISDFDNSRHDLAHRKRIDGKYACTGIFTVFVREGDQVSPDKPVTLTVTPYSARSKTVTINLYSTRSRQPKYVDEPGCVRNGGLTIPIADMMHLPHKQRAIKVAMYFGRTELEVEAINTFSQQKQRVKVSYSYTHGD